VWKSEHEVISLEQFAFDNLYRAVFPVPAMFMYLIMLYSFFVLMHKKFFLLQSKAERQYELYDTGLLQHRDSYSHY